MKVDPKFNPNNLEDSDDEDNCAMLELGPVQANDVMKAKQEGAELKQKEVEPDNEMDLC